MHNENYLVLEFQVEKRKKIENDLREELFIALERLKKTFQGERIFGSIQTE